MYYLILSALALVVIVLAAKSSMLRNEVFNQTNFCNIAANTNLSKPKPSFSLGRTQLAFWTVIIISSYIFVYISATPQGFIAPFMDPVNLTLLGIAAGTTVVSKVIDNSQKDAPNDSVPQQDYPSKGFFIDVISDENGVSVHRLQNVIWTIVVGAIYIAYVAAKSKMPDDTVITSQLLILMGISSGAYLGLKTTENKASVSDPVAAAPIIPAAPQPAPNMAVPAQP